MTVDVEDWFQVENFKSQISFESWPSRKLRIETSTNLLLDLLDGHRVRNNESKKPAPTAKATFFVLGWLAERLPQLVREITARGHEVASHGMSHDLCTSLSPAKLVQDLKVSKDKLEQLTGKKVYGYRAPSFSINREILEIIHSSGYLYDSSYNSFDGHGRYGTLSLPHADMPGSIAYRISSSFYELPVSNLTLYGHTLPLGGGGYFRLYPFSLFKKGIQRVLKNQDAFNFYMHPWEVDPGQPRVKGLPAPMRFRHYVNLSQTERKLKALLRDFENCSFITCCDYLNSHKTQEKSGIRP